MSRKDRLLNLHWTSLGSWFQSTTVRRMNEYLKVSQWVDICWKVGASLEPVRLVEQFCLTTPSSRMATTSDAKFCYFLCVMWTVLFDCSWRCCLLTCALYSAYSCSHCWLSQCHTLSTLPCSPCTRLSHSQLCSQELRWKLSNYCSLFAFYVSDKTAFYNLSLHPKARMCIV